MENYCRSHSLWQQKSLGLTELPGELRLLMRTLSLQSHQIKPIQWSNVKDKSGKWMQTKPSPVSDQREDSHQAYKSIYVSLPCFINSYFNTSTCHISVENYLSGREFLGWRGKDPFFNLTSQNISINMIIHHCFKSLPSLSLLIAQAISQIYNFYNLPSKNL